MVKLIATALVLALVAGSAVAFYDWRPVMDAKYDPGDGPGPPVGDDPGDGPILLPAGGFAAAVESICGTGTADDPGCRFWVADLLGLPW